MRVDDATQERGESWWLESREARTRERRVGGWRPREAVGSGTGERRVGGWTRERRVGGWRAERRQLRLDKREANREVGVEERRGSQHQTPEQRGKDPRERQLVAGEQKLVVGQEQRELVAGQEKGQLRLDRREANSRSWRGRTEGQSTPDTGTERRGDKIGSSEEESQDV